MKKIIIFGFSHCGTTILRAIIGHIPKVYEIVKETKHAAPIPHDVRKSFDYIVFKCPQFHEEFLTSTYRDHIKIFVVRNPLFVYSSLNRRRENLGGISAYHSLSKFIKVCREFVRCIKYPQKDLYLIKYEDMFENSYEKLKTILDSIGLEYNDEIFRNTKYTNRSHPRMGGVPQIKPSERDHKRYRQYQINQPFVNHNDVGRMNLRPRQLIRIRSSKIIRQIYPDIGDR